MTEHAKTAREAKARGCAIYYTGNPCPNGHDVPRWAATKQCIVCQPMSRTPERVKAIQDAFTQAYQETMKTGYLHVPAERDGEFWIMPQRDGVLVDDDEEVPAKRVTGG